MMMLWTTLVFDDVTVTWVESFEYAGKLEPFISWMATSASSPTKDWSVLEGEMESVS